MSFHETFKDLSMKHFVFERIGTIGLVISTASSILAYDISFDVAWQEVGGIVLADDDKVMYVIYVAPIHANSLMVNNIYFQEIM